MNETRIAEIRALVVALAESGPEPAKGPHETYGQRLLVAFSEQADVAAAALTELLGEVERLTQEVASKDVRLQGSIEFGVSQHERAEAAEAKLAAAAGALKRISAHTHRGHPAVLARRTLSELES